MKISLYLFCLFLLFMGSSKAEPDANKSGRHSHFLKYEIVFYASTKKKEAHFVATLTNVSKVNRNVEVNNKAFHASFKVKVPQKKEYEIFDKAYLTLLQTSIWFEPVIDLGSKKAVTWSIPLSTLSTLHGKPVTEESLMGSSVMSEMNVAIRPKDKSDIANNATQRSKVISIPDKD